MKKITLSIIITFFCLVAFSQQETIHKAIQSEINRNLENIHIEGMAKPYYIGANLINSNQLRVRATLGALVTSDEYTYNLICNNRILVGSPEFTNYNYMEMGLMNKAMRVSSSVPNEITEQSIKNSFWKAFDQRYKLAAEKYDSKKSALANQVIQDDDLLDYASAEKATVHLNEISCEYNKADLEDIAKKVSAVFLKFPQVRGSFATITGFKANVYFDNNEGSSATYPVTALKLGIEAVIQCKDGSEVRDQLYYYASDEKDFPETTVIINETEQMAKKLVELSTAKKFDISYDGPVLFTDQAALEIFAQTSAALKAYRKPICGDEGSVKYTQNKTSLNNRIGTKIANEGISIVSSPSQKQYDNTNLLGHQVFDMEGVVPTKELVLVENGKLKSLFNNRKPTKGLHKSNGHMYISINSREAALAPGVVEMKSEITMDDEQLKLQLANMGKEEDLEKVYIISKVQQGTCEPIYAYEYNIETGEKTLVRDVQLLKPTVNQLKKLKATSGNKKVYNVLFSTKNVGSFSITGSPASFISYDGLLFKSLSLKKNKRAIKKKLPIVDNPVTML